ncbi:hypothetical protein HG531_003034 [Fusarium graminearum]|nr:hypothetical protein HG531_003034 [Fusarium graminearum]
MNLSFGLVHHALERANHIFPDVMGGRDHGPSRPYHKTTETKVLLDNDIWDALEKGSVYHHANKLTVDSRHNKADLSGIGGAGEMGVDLLGLVLVQADEAVKDIIASRSVVVAALVVGESKGLLHSVDGLIFEKELIVFGDGDQEKNGGDVLEAVNPLLSLGSLATNVEHSSLNGTANLRREDIAFNLGWLHEDGLDVVLHALVLKRKLERLHSLENNAH